MKYPRQGQGPSPVPYEVPNAVAILVGAASGVGSADRDVAVDGGTVAGAVMVVDHGVHGHRDSWVPQPFHQAILPCDRRDRP